MSLLERERAQVRAARISAARSGSTRLLSKVRRLTKSIGSAVTNEQLEEASKLAFELGQVQTKLQRALTIANTEHLRAQAATFFGLPSAPTENGTSVVVRPSIIYCDPPWAYATKTHAMGTAGRYDSLSDAEIAALPVSGLAAEQCALLMWVTLTKIDAAMQIIAAWGFEYRTVFLVWDKLARYFGTPSPSKGTYTRPNNELLLLAVRGSMPTLGASVGQVHATSLRTRPDDHSHKPDVVRKIIVDTFGDLPRIELFARQTPPDWLLWGNEIAGSHTVGTARDANRTEVRARRNQHSGDMIKRGLVKRHGLIPRTRTDDPAPESAEAAAKRPRARASPSTLLSLDPYEQWNVTTRDTIIQTGTVEEAAAEHEHKRRRFELMLEARTDDAREPISAYISSLDLMTVPRLVSHEHSGSACYPSLTAAELADAMPLITRIQNQNADAIFQFHAKI